MYPSEIPSRLSIYKQRNTKSSNAGSWRWKPIMPTSSMTHHSAEVALDFANPQKILVCKLEQLHRSKFHTHPLIADADPKVTAPASYGLVWTLRRLSWVGRPCRPAPV